MFCKILRNKGETCQTVSPAIILVVHAIQGGVIVGCQLPGECYGLWLDSAAGNGRAWCSVHN